MEQLWGLVLSLMGGASYYLATRQRIEAYYVGLTGQIVWTGFAIHTGQWTLIFSVVMFTAINALALRRALTARHAATAKMDETAADLS